MTDLIARIESADGPSVALLLEGYQAIFPHVRFSDSTAAECKEADLRAFRFFRLLDAEAWTSAAEMLVPDNCGFFLTRKSAGVACYTAYSNTHPALALAAAALKARGV